MDGEGSGWDSWRVGDWHIPTVLAVVLWSASALSVIGYTVTAFRETVDSDPSSTPKATTKEKNPPVKPVDRGVFTGPPPGPQGPLRP